MASSVTASIYFLARNDIFNTEKPYSMRYPPTTGLPQSNVIHDERRISVENMREHLEYLKFEDCGFGFITLHSKMAYDDFSQREKIKTIYLKEIAESLKTALGAFHVFILDHVVGFLKLLLRLREAWAIDRFAGATSSPVLSYFDRQRLHLRSTNINGARR